MDSTVFWVLIIYLSITIVFTKEYYGYKASKRKCYICTYNIKNGWDRCEGPITPQTADKYYIDAQDCDYNCYLKQDLYGNVERGCYAGEYMVDPNLTGCHWQNNVLYCFCEGGKCNVQRKLEITFKALGAQVGSSTQMPQIFTSADPDLSFTVSVKPTEISVIKPELSKEIMNHQQSQFIVSPNNGYTSQIVSLTTPKYVRYVAVPSEELPSHTEVPFRQTHTDHNRNRKDMVRDQDERWYANTMGQGSQDDRKVNIYDITTEPNVYYTPTQSLVPASENTIRDDYGQSHSALKNPFTMDLYQPVEVEPKRSARTSYTPTPLYDFKAPDAPYSIPSTSLHVYPSPPVYVHEIAASQPSPREEAFMIHQPQPLQTPPILQTENAIEKPLLNIQYAGSKDKGYDDYHSGLNPVYKEEYRNPSRSILNYGDSPDKDGRFLNYEYFADNFVADKDGYSSSKRLHAHAHNEDDDHKEEATKHYSGKMGEKATDTDRHQYSRHSDTGQSHKDLHYTDSDTLQEHDENHLSKIRNKDGRYEQKEEHNLHKAGVDSYKKNDKSENHLSYDSDNRDVIDHSQSSELSGSMGFDRKKGRRFHHSDVRSQTSGGQPRHYFADSGNTAMHTDHGVDLVAQHHKYDKDNYHKLDHQEAHAHQGVKSHAAGHNMKEYNQEGFMKKFKDHDDYLDVHDDGQNYKKRMKSRHEGSYHKKDSVQQGYEKGLEKESMQLAHQDYSSAQDHGYSSVKGHYDEIKHHEHDVGARTSEARGDMSGRRNFHTDRHYHDADHHTDQQRDAKHKHGHGDLYKYSKELEGERGKDIDEAEDKLQYMQEHDVDIHHSPHETTEERHFKFRTQGSNSKLQLKHHEDFSHSQASYGKDDRHKKGLGGFHILNGEVLLKDSGERASHGIRTAIMMSNSLLPVAP